MRGEWTARRNSRNTRVVKLSRLVCVWEADIERSAYVLFGRTSTLLPGTMRDRIQEPDLTEIRIDFRKAYSCGAWAPNAPGRGRSTAVQFAAAASRTAVGRPDGVLWPLSVSTINLAVVGSPSLPSKPLDYSPFSNCQKHIWKNHRGKSQLEQKDR